MDRSDGTPTYIRLSRAWYAASSLQVHERDRMEEQFSLSLAAPGGGTYGEFMVSFYNLRGHANRVEPLSPHLEIFSDGLEVAFDEFQGVLMWLRDNPRDFTPDEFEVALRVLGIQDATPYTQN